MSIVTHMLLNTSRREVGVPQPYRAAPSWGRSQIVRHVPVRSLPADWYLWLLRSLTACSARILQRMRELAKVGPWKSYAEFPLTQEATRIKKGLPIVG